MGKIASFFFMIIAAVLILAYFGLLGPIIEILDLTPKTADRWLKTSSLTGMATDTVDVSEIYLYPGKELTAHVENNTKYYLKKIGLKFYFYDVNGRLITKRRKPFEGIIKVSKLAAGKSANVKTKRIPKNAVSVELIATKRVKIKLTE